MVNPILGYLDKNQKAFRSSKCRSRTALNVRKWHFHVEYRDSNPEFGHYSPTIPEQHPCSQGSIKSSNRFMIDTDSFLLRCNDILFCTLLLRIPLYVIILPNAMLYHLYAVVFSLQQRLPANITTTAFAGTCHNMTHSVHSHFFYYSWW